MSRKSIDPSERYQLTKDEGELSTQTVGAFGTYTEAEEYLKALGDKVGHVRYNIIDRSKNIFVDAADDTELRELQRREELVARRRKLMEEEAAIAAEEAAKKSATPSAA